MELRCERAGGDGPYSIRLALSSQGVPTMTTPKRTPREELLTTLSAEERAALVPLSESTIRTAIAEGERDRVAVSAGDQLPPVAPSLRFQ